MSKVPTDFTFNFLPEQISKEKINDTMWKITKPIDCNIVLNENEHLKYTILAGFETNFRTGPTWLESIAPKIGEPPMAMSWMIHDANYEGYLNSRKVADQLLYYMLRYAQHPPLKCRLIYIGLQLFGQFNYSDEKSNPFIVYNSTIDPRTRGLESYKENIFDKELKFDINTMENTKAEFDKLKQDYEDQSFEAYFEEGGIL